MFLRGFIVKLIHPCRILSDICFKINCFILYFIIKSDFAIYTFRVAAKCFVFAVTVTLLYIAAEKIQPAFCNFCQQGLFDT